MKKDLKDGGWVEVRTGDDITQADRKWMISATLKNQAAIEDIEAKEEAGESVDPQAKLDLTFDYNNQLMLRGIDAWSYGDNLSIDVLDALKYSTYQEIEALSQDFLAAINKTFSVDDAGDPDSPTGGSETSEITSASEPADPSA